MSVNLASYVHYRQIMMKHRERRALEERLGFSDVDLDEARMEVILSKRWRVPYEIANAWGQDRLLAHWHRLQEWYHRFDYEVVGFGGIVG